MMKKQYTFILLLVVSISLHAQITVTDATFPAAGDTLKYATDISPDGVVITPPGGPTDWDFTQLGPNFNSETVYRPASEGSAAASFTDATLFSSGAGGQGENYYAVSATAVENLGFSGPAPGGLPIQTEFRFEPAVPERRAPMNFIDNNIVNSSLNIAFAVADLPDDLPIPDFADSIRIRGEATRIDVVDAYGSLAIPGATYDVLREKRTEYRDTKLEILLFGLWVDVTSQFGGLGELGKDTIVTYNFFSNTEKEVIAIVTMDSTGGNPQSVQYKDLGLPNATGDVSALEPTVVVSPNPAAEQAVFELKHFVPGTYMLQVMDASGRLIFKKKLATASETVFLGTLGRGSYFYQILDESNQVKVTGKFLKIND